jgi:hypothetical protein
MHDLPCRSIAVSTTECDYYVDQINALAAKAARRRRWYVPQMPGAAGNDGATTGSADDAARHSPNDTQEGEIE